MQMTIESATAWTVVIGAAATGLVSIITSLRNTLKLEAAKAQASIVEGKVDQIHELTNSRLATLEAELADIKRQLVAEKRITTTQAAQILDDSKHRPSNM